MMRTLSVLLLLPLLNSCCWLCGGDTKPLVPVTWEQPRSALETLLVAIENDDSRRIYQSLSPDLKKEQGIDGMSFAVGWEKLRQAQPYLHVAGQASVVEEKRISATRHVYLMGVHGQRFTVEFEQLCYWQVLVQDEDEYTRLSDYIDPTVFQKRILSIAEDEGRILVEFKDDQLIGIPRSDLRGLQLSTEWKVRSFSQGEEGFPRS